MNFHGGNLRQSDETCLILSWYFPIMPGPVWFKLQKYRNNLIGRMMMVLCGMFVVLWCKGQVEFKPTKIWERWTQYGRAMAVVKMRWGWTTQGDEICLRASCCRGDCCYGGLVVQWSVSDWLTDAGFLWWKKRGENITRSGGVRFISALTFNTLTTTGWLVKTNIVSSFKPIRDIVRMLRGVNRNV